MTLHDKLKQMLIKELQLVDVEPRDIGSDDILFGEKLGLDSIDALEIIHQVKQYFGIEIRNMKEGRPALQSVRTLAAFIEERQAA